MPGVPTAGDLAPTWIWTLTGVVLALLAIGMLLWVVGMARELVEDAVGRLVRRRVKP